MTSGPIETKFELLHFKLRPALQSIECVFGGLSKNRLSYRGAGFFFRPYGPTLLTLVLTKIAVKRISVNMGDEVKKILPVRLRQAREMAGLSLRGLSEATNGQVSHNAISRYEGGIMFPGSEALNAIASAVGQSLDYFIRPFQVSIDLRQVRFRKRSSKLGKKDQEAIKMQAEDFFERYCEIEEILGVRHLYDPPFDPIPVTDPNDVTRLAKELREKWELGLDPLPNVHELMELKGIKVHELPTEHGAFDGFSAMTDAGPVVVIASWLNKDIPRKRMTEVHELAHVVLNIPEEMDERQEEKLVWDFAGELLMPKEEFTDKFGRRTKITLHELTALKKHFGVSIMAIVTRAAKLGLISDSAKVEFFKFANRSGWRTNGEPGGDAYTGTESNQRFKTLVHRAVVEEKISESKGASLLRVPLPELREELKGVTFK